MADEQPDLRAQFDPPERPDWVAELNQVGPLLDVRAIVPLDPESLIHAATLATGLDDFGTNEWREPFEVSCRSLDEEGRLNLTGRILSRNDILLLLKARLQIEDTYRRHPEIEDELIRHARLVRADESLSEGSPCSGRPASIHRC